MTLKLKHILPLMLFPLLAACEKERTMPVDNGMYYWRTDLHLDKAERDFMAQHGIKRLFVRFFDMVMSETDGPVPNATLTFSDSIADSIEVVPVVYVLNECMKTLPTGIAEKLVNRIWQMCETNGIAAPKELQIDCDWTASTRENYFKFLHELRRCADIRGAQLSVTIRLHQLRESPPPADCGVLMLYNTGDVSRIDVEKPILDLRDVKPYITNLEDYDLPLRTAYPIFGWRALFRKNKFVGVIHYEGEYPVMPTDTIIERRPAAEDVLATYRAVEKASKGINNSVILFDLQSENITQYEADFYEKVLHR